MTCTPRAARSPGPHVDLFALTGLNAARTAPYGYYVQAVDSQGLASPASNIAQFITSPSTSLTAADTLPPSEPGTPSAGSVTSTGATLTWGASVPGTGTLAGYRVYELAPATGLVATTTAPSYTLTGLTGGTAYAYEVEAIDSQNRTSQFAAPATFYTGAPGTPPTTPPTTTPPTTTPPTTTPPTADADPDDAPTPRHSDDHADDRGARELLGVGVDQPVVGRLHRDVHGLRRLLAGQRLDGQHDPARPARPSRTRGMPRPAAQPGRFSSPTQLQRKHQRGPVDPVRLPGHRDWRRNDSSLLGQVASRAATHRAAGRQPPCADTIGDNP